jgi:hypothetical protein
MKGAAALYRAREECSLSSEKLRAIRASLIKANRAAPNDAMPLYFFYRSFTMAGETPSENALDGLATAQHLAPQVARTTLALGSALANRKQARQAHIILKPLAHSPHGSPAAERAQQILANLASAATPPALEDDASLGAESGPEQQDR